MEIIVQGTFEECKAEILKIAKALGIGANAQAVETTVENKAEEVPAKKSKPKKEEPAPVEEVEDALVDAEEEAEEETKKYTKADVQALCKKAMNIGGAGANREMVTALIAKYSTNGKLAGVDEQYYAGLAKELEKEIDG